MGQTWLAKYGTYEEEINGHQEGITAHAGGGQASATALTAKFNTVDTVATDYDSVKLISAKQGHQQFVFNNTAQWLAVYPASSQKMNGSTLVAYYVAPWTYAVFECPFDGNWIVTTNLTYTVAITLTSAQIKTLHSAPIDICPAPGNGLAVVAESAEIAYTKATTNYTGGGTLQIIQESSSNAPQLQGSVDFTNTTSFFQKLIAGSGAVNIIANKKLQLTNLSTNFSNGDGTAKVYVKFKIITV